MERRKLLLALAAAPLAFTRICAHAQAKTMKDIDALQKNWKNFLPAGATVPSASEPLKLSKDEWKKRLPPQSYNVLREEGTERAGTSPLNDEKRAGIYACAGCGLPVFTSEMKFESGTGWPSFFTTIPGAFDMKKDFYRSTRAPSTTASAAAATRARVRRRPAAHPISAGATTACR
jgi:peptide-methionine (R)-S-oxide reductase